MRAPVVPRMALRARRVPRRLRASVVALASLVAIAGVSGRASAQQLPAAEASALVPPHLKTDSGAVYPEAALRAHVTATVVVTLVLVVDAQGAVHEATATSVVGAPLPGAPSAAGTAGAPAPGALDAKEIEAAFDEAAVTAAKGLVFEPATRDGTPIAAKIKFQYTFAPPAPRLVGRVARQVSDTPIAGAQVVVRDAAGAEHTTSTAEDGSWTVTDVPPGRAHIAVTAAGKLPAETDEDLAPGEETSVVLRLTSESVAPPPEAAAAPGEVVQEVTVKGDRPPREVTRRTLDREEIEHSPGTHGDALLSLSNLPGVARPPVFSGALIVRGSAPEDTNIFIDGTNIPIAYHFGGLSSVVPSELLDRIDFYPGNYSAVYGRGMGGVVDVGIRDPKKDGFHGFVQEDILGARLLVEGPLGAGWSFLAAAQRSWTDLVLEPVLKASSSGPTALPSYYDYQVELEKDFDSHASLRLLFFGSDDAINLVNATPDATDPTLGGDLGYHTNFWRLQARFEDKVSDRTRIRVTAAYGQDLAAISLGTNLLSGVAHPLSGRAEISEKLGPGLVANVGLDMLDEPIDLTLQLPPFTRPGEPQGGPGQLPVRSTTTATLFEPAAYAELEAVPWAGTRVVPGLRADYDSATGGWDISPRINARQDLRSAFPRTTLKGGIGLYDQPPSPFDTDPRFGQAGLASNRSLQTDLGFEQEFTRHLDLSVDVFDKQMDRLVVLGAGNSGEGRAYGVEWLLRYKPDAHFFGWISYTLSRSERRDLPTEPFMPFQYDQTHVLNVIGSYKLGRGWQLGARFRLTSGDLYTPTTTGAYDATVGTQLGVSAFPEYGARFPLFRQLDLRIDKMWTFRHFNWSWYLDIQNVTNASNALSVQYNYNYTQSGTVSGLPIIPILGVRLDYHQ